MNIELHGLTDEQVAYCDIIWNLRTTVELEKFLSWLPTDKQLMCRSLIELMQLSFLDELDNTNEAQSVLDRFKLA